MKTRFLALILLASTAALGQSCMATESDSMCIERLNAQTTASTSVTALVPAAKYPMNQVTWDALGNYSCPIGKVCATPTAQEIASHAFYDFHGETAPAPPRDAHDYALSVLKRYNAATHSTVDFPLYEILLTAKRQTIAVDKNGKVVYSNITPDDAVLLLIAFNLERNLTEMEAWNRRQNESAMAPPTTVKTPRGKYAIIQRPESKMPKSSSGIILGDTYCGLRTVLIDMDDGEKRATVMHELMHVATDCDPDPREHKVIYQLAPALLRLLQENPDIVRYLTASVKTQP